MSDNREYIHPVEEMQEKHEKKLMKKKKKKRFILMLIILLLLIAIFMLMNHLGIGLGRKSGDDSGAGEESAQSTASQDESPAADESSETEKIAVQLRISGSTYIFADKVYTLEEFEKIAAVMDKNAVVIELCDDNAVSEAVNDMHSMLDGLGIAYTDTVYSGLSSENPDVSRQDSEV